MDRMEHTDEVKSHKQSEGMQRTAGPGHAASSSCVIIVQAFPCPLMIKNCTRDEHEFYVKLLTSYRYRDSR